MNILINDFSGEKYRLCLTQTPNIPSPRRDTKRVSIRGRNGSLTTKYGYEDLEFSVELNLLEDGIKPNIRAIKAWVYNATKVSFTDEPEYFYRILDAWTEDIENDLNIYGKFTASFIAEPFQFKNKPPIVGTLPYYFTNEGTVPMDLLVEITNPTPSTPSTYVVATGSGWVTLGPLDINNPSITLDSRLQQAYVTGDISKLRNTLVNGTIPKFAPGACSLSVDVQSGVAPTVKLNITEAYL